MQGVVLERSQLQQTAVVTKEKLQQTIYRRIRNKDMKGGKQPFEQCNFIPKIVLYEMNYSRMY
jgi:hypothetical protein